MPDGAVGGATGGGGVPARSGMAGGDGTVGGAGGFAAIAGGAGGVTRGAAGLVRGLGCVVRAGAGRAAVADRICDGGFSVMPLESDAPLLFGMAGAAGANRASLFWRVFGINSERTPGRSNCGTFCGVPSESSTLRSTVTDPVSRCACAVGATSPVVRRARAAAVKARGAAADKSRANLEAIISNPNNERVTGPDAKAPDRAT